jgi:hypothetical protein
MTALKDTNFCTLTVMGSESLRLKYQNFGRLFLHSSVLIFDLQTRRKLMTWVAFPPIIKKNHSATEIWAIDLMLQITESLNSKIVYYFALQYELYRFQFNTCLRPWPSDTGTFPLIWRVWCGNFWSAFSIYLYYWIVFLQVRLYRSQVCSSQEFNS